jgi:Flp pilus assembly protein TadD
MSLLLEALRRAEEEAQKNKLTEALVPTPATAQHEELAAVAAMTHRQAMSAAGVMAGHGQRTSGASALRRKRWFVVLALTLVVAVPVPVGLLFGDFFVDSFRLLTTTAPIAPVIPAALPITQPVLLLEATDALDPLTLPPSFEAPSPVPKALPMSTSKPRPRPLKTEDSSQATVAVVAAATAATGPILSVTASAAKPDALLASAYAAYQAGNSAEASRLYRQVLKLDANQRDAWLGLAVMAHTDNQREPAQDAYKRVLRLEPQNATALAGLHSLSGQAGEPQQESRLRELLARSPEEPDLNHALGLVLSGAKRWSEAQPLFFKAHQLAPQEPRFAYNLAVTLDHLRKPSLARQYYEASLLLVQDGDAGFDESSARRRLAVLGASSTPRSMP